MVNDKTYTNSLADFTLEFFLQIPQGNSVEIKVEPSQCNFYLNQKVVEQIQQAKKTGISLEIPTKLLINLWYCICFQHNLVPDKTRETEQKKSYSSYLVFLLNIFNILRIKALRNQTHLQIGCTFNSYYSPEELASEKHQEQECLVQSIVLFYGDVIQKIQEDFLHNNPHCSMIISTHYWLVEQLLSSLRNKLNLLVWEFSSFLTAVFLTSKIHNLNNVLLFILNCLGIGLFILACRYLLVKQIQQLIYIKHEYLNWLAWLISCLIPAIAISLTQKIYVTDFILFSSIAGFLPVIIRQILTLIWPQMIRLMVRRVL